MTVLAQPVTAIEGVGPATASKLSNAGVAIVADLLTRPSGFVYAAAGKRFGAERSAAHLLRIDGLRPDIAEALLDANISSLSALATAGLQTPERACDRAVKARRLGDAPSLYELAGFQREATELDRCGLVIGTVTRDGQPITGGTVTASRRRATLDEHGRFVLDGLDPGRHRVSINVAGRPIAHGFNVVVDQGTALSRDIKLPKSADDHCQMSPELRSQGVITSDYADP